MHAKGLPKWMVHHAVFPILFLPRLPRLLRLLLFPPSLHPDHLTHSQTSRIVWLS